MQLRELGEFRLIDRIARAATRAGAGGRRSPHVSVGIGDDAAVLRPRAGEDLVASTDAFVENVHFRWRNQAPRKIGQRAAAACLSDLAAMGARPLGMLVALAAPPSLDVRRLDGVTRGLVEMARRYGAPLVGGNVTRARETSFVLTGLGAVKRGQQLLRSSARRGDRILVTGTLGRSALEVRAGGRVRHLPEPRLAAGQKLARVAGVGACIDISDGLVADLRHMLRASKVGARIDLGRLPKPRGFARRCEEAHVDPAHVLLAGGEDYELLFTLRTQGPSAAALSRRLGVPVSEIGEVTARGLSLTSANKKPTRGGWRAF